MPSQDKDVKYIHERLESLNGVESGVVSVLENLSLALSSLQEGLSGQTQAKEQFQEGCKGFYENLSTTSVKLRREIKLLDNKMGKNNNDISILPINIDKKATWIGDSKLKAEVDQLDKISDKEV